MASYDSQKMSSQAMMLSAKTNRVKFTPWFGGSKKDEEQPDDSSGSPARKPPQILPSERKALGPQQTAGKKPWFFQRGKKNKWKEAMRADAEANGMSVKELKAQQKAERKAKKDADNQAKKEAKAAEKAGSEGRRRRRLQPSRFTGRRRARRDPP